MNFTFIDLFCGIGGFHQAMSSLGGKCVFASDIDKNCRKIYERNYGTVPEGDITSIPADHIPTHNMLCAGFPCQSFSKAGNRLGFGDKTKGTLFFEICRIAEHHRPEYILLENVRNLVGHDGGNTWKTIKESLEDLGYDVPETPTIFSPHFIGIPQHRERVFITAVRKDIGNAPTFPTEFPSTECSIDSVLSDDSEITDIGRYLLKPEQIEWIENWNEFIRNIKCDRLPGFPIWTEYFRDLDSISDIENQPKWKQNYIRKNSELYVSNRDFIDTWLNKARKNPCFFGSKAKLEWQAGHTDNPDIWDNIMQIRPSGLRVKPGTYFPALVAITQTSIIGKRKRFMTPRECARLQSFPDTFICDEKDSEAYKQFGNSVNVEAVRLFAEAMLTGKTRFPIQTN